MGSVHNSGDKSVHTEQQEAQTEASRSPVDSLQEGISPKRDSQEEAASTDDIVFEPEWTDDRERESVQRIRHQQISPDQVIIVEARPNYLHSAKFLGLGFFLGVATTLGLGVFLFPSETPAESVAQTAAPLPSSAESLANSSSNSPPTAAPPETKAPVTTAPVTTEQPPVQNMDVTVQPPTPPPPSVEATVSSATSPTPPQPIKPRETPQLESTPVASQTDVSKQIESKPEVTLPTGPDSRTTQAEDDVTDTRFSVERDGDGRIVARKTKPSSVGSAPLIDKIGVKAKYSYLTGPEPISATYFDSHNKVIAVEVEVMGIVEDGVASAVGLHPGDRLLSYGGEKLRSVQRLVFLTGIPGEAPRKLSYRHGKKVFTVEVPAGRLGVEVKNAKAAHASRVVPTSEMQTEN